MFFKVELTSGNYNMETLEKAVLFYAHPENGGNERQARAHEPVFAQCEIASGKLGGVYKK